MCTHQQHKGVITIITRNKLSFNMIKTSILSSVMIAQLFANVSSSHETTTLSLKAYAAERNKVMDLDNQIEPSEPLQPEVTILAQSSYTVAMQLKSEDDTNIQNIAISNLNAETNTEITTVKVFGANNPAPNHNNHITKRGGVYNGPSGKETYYNLPMQGVIRIMRNLGYSEEEYPYWIRKDGVKMFGDYIMVAANLDIRPKGTILECSLGTAIVCDTGDFAKTNKTQLDIAVDWR